MGVYQLLLILVVAVLVVEGSHFRGGVITWRPSTLFPPPAGFLNVLFDYRVAFRTSSSADHNCSDETIQSRIRNAGEGSLECDNGCTGLNDDLDYQCTDFSVEADWTTGRGNSQFTTATNSRFDVYYEGEYWIPLANGGNGPWMLRSTVDITTRSDNGRINTSPTTGTMPIVRLQRTCPQTLSIPVADADNDIVRCRWALANADECGSICGPPDSEASLNEDDCELTWAPMQLGLFGVAIQIEDFMWNVSNPVPLSDIPLQFLIEVFEGDGDCDSSPKFGPVVLPGDSCIAVRPGGTFTTRIQAAVSSPSRSIMSIDTVSPVGLTTSPVQQVPGSDLDYFIDVTFTSALVMQLQEIFCFVAEDNGGLTSEQRCIFLVTATSPPTALTAITDENNQLTIATDMTVSTPSSPRIIEIVSDQSQGVIFTLNTSTDATVADGGDGIVLQLPTPLPPGGTYTVRLDRGVFESNDFCGVENEPTILAITADMQPEPTGDCPADIMMNAGPGESMVFVSWDAPNLGQMVAGPSETSGSYPVGTDIIIRYIFINGTNDYVFCVFNILIGPDPQPCSMDMEVHALRGTGGAIVTWIDPATPDRIIDAPIPSGSFFTPGTTCVSINFNRTIGVVDTCTFYVTVTEASPCDNRTCENNSTCVASDVDSFTCVCETDCYVGDYCEIPIHSCATGPCLNGGYCKLLEGSCTVSLCECPPCYTGPLCETPIDACYGNLCKDGSECRAVEGSCDRYECECADCVFGAFCEIAVPNPCEFDSCKNGLECAVNPENCYGYNCLSSTPDPSCVSGGLEIPVSDKCLNSPCLNNAICVPTTMDVTSDRSEGFTCLCQEGYAGYLCGEKIEYNLDIQVCSNDTCQNGGVCYNSFTSFNSLYTACEYTCVCPDNSTGKNCLKTARSYSPCSSNAGGDPCVNGNCMNLFISPSHMANHYCECDAGFVGSRCDEQIDDPCLSTPCFNDGSCTQRGTTFRCTCADGWYGPTCEIRLTNMTILPLVLDCPDPIIQSSDTPIAVQWAMPTVLDFGSNVPARLVSANLAPGAVLRPGQLKWVDLVFEGSASLQVTCNFWIYVDPITLIQAF